MVKNLVVIKPIRCISSSPKVGLIIPEKQRLSQININVIAGNLIKVTDGHASCDASDIKMRHRADTITVHISKSETYVFQYVATKYDSGNVADFWSYHCRHNDRALRLTVYNN